MRLVCWCCGALGFLLVASGSLQGHAQGKSQVGTAPFQATLDVPIDTAKIRAGATFFASAMVPWHGPDCFVKAGGTVYGRVVEVQSRDKGAPDSHVTLVFDKADCNGKREVPTPLLLYAVVDMTQQPDPTTMRDTSGLMGSISPHPPMGTSGSYAAPVITTGQEAHNDMSTGLRNDQPGQVKAGQVVGLDKVLLSVGTGTEGGSVVHSTRKNFTLHQKAELVLVAAPAKTGPAKPSMEEGKPAEAPRAFAEVVVPPPPPVDETEICAVDCSAAVDGMKDAVGSTPAAAEATVPVGRFGYRPKSHAEMTAFDDETTVNYLSADEILLTFDPHRLRERVGEPWHAGTRRSVRAVLIDAHTHKVKRALDWMVDSDGPYLWKAGPGRVLVQMGGALHEIGAGLKTISIFPVFGDVQWVVASPSGGHIAIGSLHERHSQEVHERIARWAHGTPEEDLEVTLLNPERKTLVTVTGSSETHAPVLADSGEVRVRVAGPHRWQLTEIDWAGKHTPIVTVNSDCEPVVSAPLTGKLFIAGCSAGGGQRWYRMVRMDGHTVLKGSPSSHQLELSAVGGGQGEFAVRVVETTLSTVYGGMVRAEQLRQERVDVYSGGDGRRLFAIQAEKFPQSNENFALSPDGRQLAVLTAGEVALYRVVGTGAAAAK